MYKYNLFLEESHTKTNILQFYAKFIVSECTNINY